MKKAVLIVCALLVSTFTFAKEAVPLTVTGPDYSSLGNGHNKAPFIGVTPPNLYIDDYMLSFSEGHADYVLNIKNVDGDIVFTTLVYSAQTEVSLPATLSGNYEVELTMGNWKFTGYITLL